MKIGIFGGTFSPVHYGHIRAALAFADQFALDRLYVMPANIPPHKAIPADDDPKKRLEMTRLAFADADARIVVSDFELQRPGKSYTVDTLRHFSVPGENTLYLLCGTDMFLTLDTWREAEAIFRLAVIVCVRREADAETAEKIASAAARYRAQYGAQINTLSLAASPISSTALRDAVAAGAPISAYVPPAVETYIRAHGLYRKSSEENT